MRDDEKEDDEMLAFLGDKDGAINTEALHQIAKFDNIISKSCQICLLDELDIDERHKGWFQIIRFLQAYKNMAAEKVKEALDSVKQEIGSMKFSALKTENLNEFVTVLKLFVQKRIDYILRFPSLNINLKTLFEQLNLTQKQLTCLTTEKMKFGTINFAIENSQSSIARGQLHDMFLNNARKMVSQPSACDS